jgi:hypothetical protein
MDSPERQTRIVILWHTGATTELVAMRLTTGDKLRTPEKVVQTIRELAAHMTDVEIAIELNQRGLTSGKGRAFTADSVGWIRWKFQINKPERDLRCVRALGVREDGCYSTSALAKKLGVGIHTVHYWREKGVLEAFQETPNGPWWHWVTPDVLQTLREKIRRVPVKSE